MVRACYLTRSVPALCPRSSRASWCCTSLSVEPKKRRQHTQRRQKPGERHKVQSKTRFPNTLRFVNQRLDEPSMCTDQKQHPTRCDVVSPQHHRDRNALRRCGQSLVAFPILSERKGVLGVHSTPGGQNKKTHSFVVYSRPPARRWFSDPIHPIPLHPIRWRSATFPVPPPLKEGACLRKASMLV